MRGCYGISLHFCKMCKRSFSSVRTVDKSKKVVRQIIASDQKAMKLRNVGIIAHIDAGKTTTTERLLYFSGTIDDIGNIDRGTTVMDFMDQEQERGITIQSAAISVLWRNHRINIIDTPGHIDFTVEVERALWALDSAVGVIDVCAGVEAQTKTVWRQADKFNLPRLVYLNKMDRKGADVHNALRSMADELGIMPLLIQHHIGIESNFEGVIDLLTMNRMTWSTLGDVRVEAPAAADSLQAEALQSRQALIDGLAEVDPTLMDSVIAASSYDDIDAAAIKDSLRRATCRGQVVPVLLGSSLRSQGVEPLLDAVIDYLPGADETALTQQLPSSDDLCAFAFKTIHQRERGAVTFLRLFGGAMKGSSTVYNHTQETGDKIGKLYTVMGSQLLETRSTSMGNIIAVTGLESTVTGDVLVDNSRSAERYQTAGVSLPSLLVPDPVVMCSIEPYSSREQKQLVEALNCLAKEDPSLRVKYDEEMDQLTISGMGELHLEVVRERLAREHKLQVYMGPALIAYREVIKQPSAVVQHEVNRQIGDTVHHVIVSVSLAPVPNSTKSAMFASSKEEDWSSLNWFVRKGINHGVQQALNAGPLLGYPVVDCGVSLHSFQTLQRKTSMAVVSATVCEAVHRAARECGVLLSEPVMRLEISCDPQHTGDILADLAQRRASISSVSQSGSESRLTAEVPVESLFGYSTLLRRLTSGTARFSMEVQGYLTMTDQQTQTVVQKHSGIV